MGSSGELTTERIGRPWSPMSATDLAHDDDELPFSELPFSKDSNGTTHYHNILTLLYALPQVLSVKITTHGISVCWQAVSTLPEYYICHITILPFRKNKTHPIDAIGLFYGQIIHNVCKIHLGILYKVKKKNIICFSKKSNTGEMHLIMKKGSKVIRVIEQSLQQWVPLLLNQALKYLSSSDYGLMSSPQISILFRLCFDVMPSNIYPLQTMVWCHALKYLFSSDYGLMSCPQISILFRLCFDVMPSNIYPLQTMFWCHALKYQFSSDYGLMSCPQISILFRLWFDVMPSNIYSLQTMFWCHALKYLSSSDYVLMSCPQISILFRLWFDVMSSNINPLQTMFWCHALKYLFSSDYGLMSCPQISILFRLWFDVKPSNIYPLQTMVWCQALKYLSSSDYGLMSSPQISILFRLWFDVKPSNIYPLQTMVWCHALKYLFSSDYGLMSSPQISILFRLWFDVKPSNIYSLQTMVWCHARFTPWTLPSLKTWQLDPARFSPTTHIFFQYTCVPANGSQAIRLERASKCSSRKRRGVPLELNARQREETWSWLRTAIWTDLSGVRRFRQLTIEISFFW